jgi:acyl carrier protein
MTIVSTQEAADSILYFVRQRSPAASEILSSNTPLLEGVLDSLGVVELVAFLTETYGVEITDEDLVPLNFETIAHAVSFLERKGYLSGAAA